MCLHGISVAMIQFWSFNLQSLLMILALFAFDSRLETANIYSLKHQSAKRPPKLYKFNLRCETWNQIRFAVKFISVLCYLVSSVIYAIK